MGSVKDLEVIKTATEREMGIGIFRFSDRYSVFDWGEMPDHIENKGASLCAMSAYFFEKLGEESVRTHYLGVENGNGYGPLGTANKPPAKMKVLLARVIRPEIVYEDGKPSRYDYTPIQQATGNFVIPVEVIYRNSLPKGSSVFKRLQKGLLTPQDLGLSEMPKEGDRLPTTFVDGSTKYEEFDRYPGWQELQKLSGLYDDEVELLKIAVLHGNNVISEGMRRTGMVNEDGKLEFVFDEHRSLMVGDMLGTLDECRVTYRGTDVSKEIPRQHYKRTQPEWAAEIDSAKEQTKKGWKQLVKSRPETLPHALKEIMENLYPAVANAVIGRQLFPGVPAVPEVVTEYHRFREAEMK